MLSNDRAEKLKDYIRQRQYDLTVVLENIHDPHNIGAIMRTCDAVGIDEIYVIYTQDGHNYKDKYVGAKASRGTTKWVNCHFYEEIAACVPMLKEKGFTLCATHLSASSEDLYDLDLSHKVALVFGNEKEGISEELLQYCEINYKIPIAGLVQSLNVSVAVAVSLYESMRQRKQAGRYDLDFDPRDPVMIDKFREAVIKTYPRVADTDISKIDKIVTNHLGK